MTALRVITSEGAPATLEEATVQSFADSLRGRLLQRGDDGYDEARKLFNGMIDRRPALIAQCHGAADIAAAVRFAREHNLIVSIKGGGHSVTGNAVCYGGLMIDPSRMKSIRVDPAQQTVRAEPGVLGGELDRETQAFGLSTPVGSVSSTGISGLTLGGGQSWLASKHGLAIDNLLSVDIVTADGTLRTASATRHEDLFWGVRGAGHNFGVVTSFEYQLHPVGPVLGGMVIHPLSQAVEALRFYRDFTASQPDALQTWAGLLTLPDGNQVLAIVPCYLGSLAEGERADSPATAVRKPGRGHGRSTTLRHDAADLRPRLSAGTAQLLEIGAGRPPHRRAHRSERRTRAKGALAAHPHSLYRDARSLSPRRQNGYGLLPP